MGAHTKTGMHVPLTASWGNTFFNKYGYTQAPVVIQCYLTLRCNLSCAHCLAAPSDDRDRKDLPLELFDKLCHEAAALGEPEMLLTGGEPLQHEQLAQCLDRLKYHRLTWSLNTATCPTPAQQFTIRAYPPVFVAVSLDGPREVHNAFRGHPTAYEAAMASLRFFAGLPETVVCAGTTVSTVNFPHLDETFAIVRQSGAHRWGIHLLIPEGRARQRKDLFLRTAHLRKLLKFIAQKRAEFPVSLCDEMGRVGQWEHLVRDEAFFCAAGRAMCAVLPDGSVMPCSTLDPRHCEGNLTREAFATIWNSRFERQRFPRRLSKCAACDKWFECGSGCWLHRQQGTQCFKQVWKVPTTFKTAASISVLLGSLGAQGAELASPSAASNRTVITSANASNTPVIFVKQPIQLTLKKGVYGGKAGYRGDPQLALAVIRSLRWLQNHQDPDGSWSKDQPVLITSLALLCFMENAVTPSHPEFGATVEKAIGYLVGQQRNDGSFNPPVSGKAHPYTHAIATYALGKTYAMTRIPDLGLKTQKATRFILDRQQAGGGWGMTYAKDGDWNLTFSAWQIMALRTSLWAVPEADAALTLAESFVQKTTFIDGAFRNSPAPQDRNEICSEVQGAGALSLLFLGTTEHGQIRTACHWIRETVKINSDDPLLVPSKSCMNGSPFQFFFHIWALFFSRDGYLSFNRQMASDLSHSQTADGHWDVPQVSGAQKSAIGRDEDFKILLITTLNCLALEPDRKQRLDLPPRPSKVSDSDVVVKIL